MSERGSYRRGLSFAALSTITLAAVGLVSSIAIARLYGLHVMGLYTLAIAPGLALTYLSTAKEQVALIRLLAVLPARAPRITGLFWAVFGFSTLLTLAVALLILGITYVLFTGPVDQPDLFLVAVADTAAYVTVVNTAWNLDSIFIAFRAGRQLFWARLIQAAGFPVLAVAGSFASDSVWWLVAAGAGSWVLSLAYRWVAVRRFMTIRVRAHEVREGLGELPEMIRFGLKLAPGGVAAGLSSQIGVWVLGAVGTVAAVGAYGRAWLLSSRLVTANTRISEMLLPTLVERRESNDAGGFDRAVGESMRYAALGLLLPAAVGGGAAVGVMDVFGPGFDAGADALAILLLVPALAAMLGIQGQSVPTAVGRPTASTVISVSRALITLAFTVPLTHAMGAAGTALAFVAGSVVMLPVVTRTMRVHLSERLARWYGPRDVVAVGAAYASGFLAARLIDSAIDAVWGVGVAVPGGMLAYAAAFILAGGVRERDIARLRELLGRRSELRRRPARVQG